ncbi:MAG: geranylgeranylglycerol-phosphate geranylgeranyltransferase [Bacteroidota bacterium]
MTKFLQLIRFPNLVMMALTQFLIYKYWIVPYDTCYMQFDLFIYVILSTVCIAAGGNIINDIFDVQTDRINKPHKLFIGTFISKKLAYVFYAAFTIFGIGLGTHVGFEIERGGILFLFTGISVLLFLYSSHLKGIPVIGNIVVSGVIASSIFILPVFYNERLCGRDDIRLFNQISLVAISIFTVFAFLINLMREMVKDIEDINGDYNANIMTLPILLGRNRVNKIVAVLAGITILFALYCISEVLKGKTVTTIYVLVTILLPLLYFIIKIWQADTKSEYRMLSLLLKLIMLFGILSTLVFYYFDPIDPFS